MSIKIGDEEFIEFSDLYNDSDFLTIEERKEIEKEVALIKEPTIKSQVSDDLIEKSHFCFSGNDK